MEVLDDGIFHVELGPSGPAPTGPIPTSPFVVKQSWSGPTHLFATATSVESPRQGLRTDGACLKLSDPQGELTRICSAADGLRLARGSMRNAYGLGEMFRLPGEANGDWVGDVRNSPLEAGNSLVAFEGGAVGNALFPVLYALGEGMRGYAIFVDSPRAQTWDLRQDPWSVRYESAPQRFYLMGGESLKELRRKFLALTGRPPVPPRKAFGLWVSEFGYRNWGEVEDKLNSLRKNQFPVDGFVLDAYWGGSFDNAGAHNHIGAMEFDPQNFPDPRGHLERYREQQGVGIMLHEDPFVNTWLPSFRELDHQGGFLKSCESCGPRVLDNYLGKIGIIDWTNDQTADFWHRARRQPLIDLGVTFHWTDFAEVDNYTGNDWYAGAAPFGHSVAESIARGYAEVSHSNLRPFIVSRSGTAGSQRFGTALWSGDIGSNLRSLSAHLNAQLHLSLSGLDYFGSDVGGYHREALQGDMNDVYTKWFAHSAAFDVPLRPHTDNGSKTHPTAPDRIGDTAANLASLRLRYELSPY